MSLYTPGRFRCDYFLYNGSYFSQCNLIAVEKHVRFRNHTRYELRRFPCRLKSLHVTTTAIVSMLTSNRAQIMKMNSFERKRERKKKDRKPRATILYRESTSHRGVGSKPVTLQRKR